jgi:asparagine synthase (glutamine-hydrolysing)
MTGSLNEEIAGVFDPSGSAPERSRLVQALERAGCGAPVDTGPLLLGGTAVVDRDATVVALTGRARVSLDPEVSVARTVARDYARQGAEILHQLDGPFAIAVWSRERSEGLLAQDQLGGRSLFISDLGGRVVFASEVALLLDVLGSRPGPDPVAMVHWLVDHRVHDGRTLYARVTRLGAGRCLSLDRRAARTPRRWWVPRYQPPLAGLPEDLSGLMRTAVQSEVAWALEPGKGNAVCVSGGLDSSLVAALAGKVAAKRDCSVRAITAVFPDEPDFDEWRWAEPVIEAAGLESDRVPVLERDPLQLAFRWLEAWQLPLPAPGYMIERPLLDAARDRGAAVVLDGQGGDELFGVAGFLLGDRLRQGRLISAWRLARRYPGFGAHPPPRQVARLLRLLGVPAALPYPLQERLRHRRTWPVPAWLPADLANLHRDTSDPWGWKRRRGPLWWRSLADVLTEGREVADIADYVRRRGRLAGVDARSPLLSLPLVELALRLPPELNFDPRWTRALAREGARGLLPEKVRRRTDKTDFSGLYFRALTAPSSLARLRDLFAGQPEIGAFVDIGEIHAQVLERVPELGRPGWASWMTQAWNLASAEAWLQVQSGRSLPF